MERGQSPYCGYRALSAEGARHSSLWHRHRSRPLPLKCECYRVGGTDDHVHLAIRIHRTVCVSDLVEALKTGSSKWIKGEAPHLATFSWQRGYGAFSLRVSELNPILEYVDNQAEHHRERSFQDEYRALLREQGIAIDERYVWD